MGVSRNRDPLFGPLNPLRKPKRNHLPGGLGPCETPRFSCPGLSFLLGSQASPGEPGAGEDAGGAGGAGVDAGAQRGAGQQRGGWAVGGASGDGSECSVGAQTEVGGFGALK